MAKVTIPDLDTISKSIQEKRAALDEAKNNHLNEIKKINRRCKTKIKKLAPELKKLMQIANEMQNAGFQLGTMGGHEPSPEFVTNWWSHRIGFYPGTHPTSFGSPIRPLAGFGVMNGGAFGNVDLIITQDGEITSPGRVYDNGKMVDVIDFVEGFKEFKAKFIDYVNKVTKK